MCVSCYFDLNTDKTPISAPAPKVSKKPAVARSSAAATPPTPPPPSPGMNPNFGSVGTMPPSQPDYTATPFRPPAPMTMEYAGFGLRFLAFLIDTLLLIAVAYVISLIIGGDTTAATANQQMSPDENIKAIAKLLNGGENGVWISNLINVIYFVGMNTAFGATLGKMALGLKLVKSDGSPISLGTAIIRYIIESILAALTCGLMFISIATSPTKQGWHDSIAGTAVIRTR